MFDLTDYTADGLDEPTINNAGEYNDNQTTVSLGTSFLGLGKEYVPFMLLRQNSGYFNNTDEEEVVMTETSIIGGLKGVL